MASTTAPIPGDPKPKGFLEDIVAAILNPGYIGAASMTVVNVALVLVICFIGIRVFSDPRGLSELENSIHLLALIPAIGLLFSINWYAHMAASIKKAEKEAAQKDAQKADSKKAKDKKKKIE